MKSISDEKKNDYATLDVEKNLSSHFEVRNIFKPEYVKFRNSLQGQESAENIKAMSFEIKREEINSLQSINENYLVVRQMLRIMYSIQKSLNDRSFIAI